MTIAIVTSITLMVLLTIDIVLTIKKMVDMHRLLKLIEHGEISYIQAVKSIVDLHGANVDDDEVKPQRRGKAVPWSQRNCESQSH